LLLRPGDAVAVEDPGYTMAWEAFRSVGAKIVPVKMDQYGIDPDHLEHQIGQHPVRQLYTTPLHQFPTTVTMPITRRRMIYEIAERHGVPILEDDYDHEYHYRFYPLSPMAASDPVGLVIYTSTFSKVIFPSIRLGFMVLPKEFH
jgi:GntR family transcriptional regulator/MocR family aminotransferase